MPPSLAHCADAPSHCAEAVGALRGRAVSLCRGPWRIAPSRRLTVPRGLAHCAVHRVALRRRVVSVARPSQRSESGRQPKKAHAERIEQPVGNHAWQVDQQVCVLPHRIPPARMPVPQRPQHGRRRHLGRATVTFMRDRPRGEVAEDPCRRSASGPMRRSAASGSPSNANRAIWGAERSSVRLPDLQFSGLPQSAT